MVEGGAEEHGAEAVGESAYGLGGEDATGVDAQLGSPPVSRARPTVLVEPVEHRAGDPQDPGIVEDHGQSPA